MGLRNSQIEESAKKDEQATEEYIKVRFYRCGGATSRALTSRSFTFQPKANLSCDHCFIVLATVVKYNGKPFIVQATGQTFGLQGMWVCSLYFHCIYYSKPMTKGAHLYREQSLDQCNSVGGKQNTTWQHLSWLIASTFTTSKEIS
jgi:hypothetical protein